MPFKKQQAHSVCRPPSLQKLCFSECYGARNVPTVVLYGTFGRLNSSLMIAITGSYTNFESLRSVSKLADKGLRPERALRAIAETKLHITQANWKHLVCGSREAKYGSDQSVLRATATRCNSNRFEGRKRAK
jgi:hypothetical protein